MNNAPIISCSTSRCLRQWLHQLQENWNSNVTSVEKVALIHVKCSGCRGFEIVYGQLLYWQKVISAAKPVIKLVGFGDEKLLKKPTDSLLLDRGIARHETSFIPKPDRIWEAQITFNMIVVQVGQPALTPSVYAGLVIIAWNKCSRDSIISESCRFAAENSIHFWICTLFEEIIVCPNK